MPERRRCQKGKALEKTNFAGGASLPVGLPLLRALRRLYRLYAQAKARSRSSSKACWASPGTWARCRAR